MQRNEDGQWLWGRGKAPYRLYRLPRVAEAIAASERVWLWDALLPEEAKRLPDELVAVDGYLDDDHFLAPRRALFSAGVGRPSVPIETLLRLLYLKHRCGLGYESLCREVGDSIGWRRFCRIG